MWLDDGVEREKDSCSKVWLTHIKAFIPFNEPLSWQVNPAEVDRLFFKGDIAENDGTQESLCSSLFCCVFA